MGKKRIFPSVNRKSVANWAMPRYFALTTCGIFAICEKLLNAGIYLQPIIYPAVAKHRSRFRISVSAEHTPQLLDGAADTIIDILKSEDIL